VLPWPTQEEKHRSGKHAKTIVELLAALELPADYEQMLAAEAITSIADLRECDKEDMTKCGIKLGHANKIRKAVRHSKPAAPSNGKRITAAAGPPKGRAKAKAAAAEGELGNSGSSSSSSSSSEEDSGSEESSSGEGSSDDMDEEDE
jgi:hypothetical protein